jgi:hypothetical protein
MAASCVGIANAALKAGKAPRRRGRAPSGREAAAVLVEQVMAAMAAAVWAVMGAVEGDEPNKKYMLPNDARLQGISK